MKKKIKINDIESIYSIISVNWNKYLKELHLTNKNLYNLISLKRIIEEKHLTIQETVSVTMKFYGAKEDEHGNLKVDPDKIDTVNKELMDFALQEEEIDYQEITIGDEDIIPSILMEAFYDFITIK